MSFVLVHHMHARRPLTRFSVSLSSEDRVRNGAARLEKMLAAKQQGRLDGFFKPQPRPEGSVATGKGKDVKGGSKRKVSGWSPC